MTAQKISLESQAGASWVSLGGEGAGAGTWAPWGL